MRILGGAALGGKDVVVSLGALCREKLGSACSQPLLDFLGYLDAKPAPPRAVQSPGMERGMGSRGWGGPDRPFSSQKELLLSQGCIVAITLVAPLPSDVFQVEGKSREMSCKKCK